MRVLVIGGEKSGKSSFGQKLAKDLCDNPYYWATLIPKDEEDYNRIQAHLDDRKELNFSTVEKQKDVTKELEKLDKNKSVLFDSIGAYFANEMFPENGVDKKADKRCLNDILKLSDYFKDFICICDNVWNDGIAYDSLTEEYREGLAYICKGLAKDFDVVLEVNVTLVSLWKGEKFWI